MCLRRKRDGPRNPSDQRSQDERHHDVDGAERLELLRVPSDRPRHREGEATHLRDGVPRTRALPEERDLSLCYVRR